MDTVWVSTRRHKLSDFSAAAKTVFGSPEYSKELLADEAMGQASEVLTELKTRFDGLKDNWKKDSIKAAIKEAGKALSVKGKGVFFPLRAALMGSFHGPQLDASMVVLGPDQCLSRIDAFLKFCSES